MCEKIEDETPHFLFQFLFSEVESLFPNNVPSHHKIPSVFLLFFFIIIMFGGAFEWAMPTHEASDHFVFFSGSQFTDGGAPCVQPMTENGERQVREWLLMFFDKNSMGYRWVGGCVLLMGWAQMEQWKELKILVRCCYSGIFFKKSFLSI